MPHSSPDPSPKPQDIARRLHGSVAQQLTAAAMIAHVLSERLESKKHPETTMAKDLMNKISAASSQLREIMKEISEQSGS